MVRTLIMNLPETIRTANGLTAEGASPALLGQLLDEYASELKTRSPGIYGALQPGLLAAQIEDALGRINLTPPDELIVWWGWRDGFRPMFGHGLRHGQLRLETAIATYKNEDLGTELEEWNPNWIRVGGTGNDGDAVSCAPSEDPPLVRAVSTWDIGTQPFEDTIRQVVSLCTPVTWWLTAIKEGWDQYNPTTGFWDWDRSLYPPEWDITHLM